MSPLEEGVYWTIGIWVMIVLFVTLPLWIIPYIVYCNVKYLRPFDDLENGYELYARMGTNGTQYIAVKSGYSLVGIIMPMKIVNAEFIDNLETLLEYSRMTRSNERSAESILEDDDEAD